MILPRQAGNVAILANSLSTLARGRIARVRSMHSASRTPEGHYGRCPLCREFVCIEFSDPCGDAPCPCCGGLLWKKELRWPLVCEDQGLPLRGDRRVRPALVRRLRRFVGRIAGRLRDRKALANVAKRPAPPPLPPSPSASTMYDPWLDG
jgi:hypothetical protein